MNSRMEERLRELNQAYLEEASRIMSEQETGERPVPSQEYEGPRPTVQLENENSKMNLATYEVSIRQVHNGFTVMVGCQTFVFEAFDTLASYMKEYFSNPRETEVKHFAGELFK